jgi:hypothetical protein
MDAPPPEMTPEQEAAWATIGWWHRIRPEYRQVMVITPLGPCLALGPIDPDWAPERVLEARRLLGFPTHP